MACRLDGTKPLSEPMLRYCELDPWEQTSVNLNQGLFISFKEMHLNVVWKLAAILSRPQCVITRRELIEAECRVCASVNYPSLVQIMIVAWPAPSHRLSQCWSRTNFSDILIEIHTFSFHYDDVIMSTIASQITSLTIVYSTIYSGADQSKHQSSASLAFVWGIHRGPVNSPHKWPVTRKMFPFDDVIMQENAFEIVVR